MKQLINKANGKNFVEWVMQLKMMYSLMRST